MKDKQATTQATTGELNCTNCKWNKLDPADWRSPVEKENYSLCLNPQFGHPTAGIESNWFASVVWVAEQFCAEGKGWEPIAPPPKLKLRRGRKRLFRVCAAPLGNPTKVWWLYATSASGAQHRICTRLAGELGVTSYRIRQYFLANPLTIEVREATPAEEGINGR